MYKKVISILLAMAMWFSMGTPAFAKETSSSMIDYDSLPWESVYVTLDNGQVVEVQVAIADDQRGSDHAATYSLTPETEVGEQKRAYVRISNDQLGAVGVVGSALDSALGSAAKSKLAEMAAAALSIKLAVIVVTVSELLTFIGAMNVLWGNEGFIVETVHEYAATYIHKEGHYIYGWSLEDVNVYWY